MLTYTCRKSFAWFNVGVNKHSVYVRYRDLYAEYDFVFLGDNGQGDLLAAQLMLERDSLVEKAAFCYDTI